VDLNLDRSGNIYVATATIDSPAGATGVLMLQGGVDGADTETPVAGIVDNLPVGSSFLNLRIDAAGNLYVWGMASSQTAGSQVMTRFTPTPNGFASPTSETMTLFNPNPAADLPSFFVGFAVF